MPQETKSKFEPGSPASAPDAGANASPAGMNVLLGDDRSTFDALEKAFDFRGDVTLELRDGRSITGYLFDRKRGRGLPDSSVRLMLPDADGQKVTIGYHEIARVAFSDRDPAAGKSFETWVKKYVEKKMRGERASIESEPLE
ncbi:MAG TPA: hypothetical protein PK308_02085 [Phycisphaerales bacterium]|jgi:hypothetical protein|nr:hypothetical protein [Phycisphaerales bacterium]